MHPTCITNTTYDRKHSQICYVLTIRAIPCSIMKLCILPTYTAKYSNIHRLFP